MLGVAGAAGGAVAGGPRAGRSGRARGRSGSRGGRREVRSSTVAVFSPGGQGGGSGVVISPDGYALSNFHVTSEAGDAMQCGMADGKLYDAVIVGHRSHRRRGADQALGPRRFSPRRDGRQRPGARRRLVLYHRQSVSAGHRFSAHRGLRRHFRRASLSVSGRHDPGICRLPASRRGDQSRQFRRSDVRRRGTADRHQRARLVREARPRERRRGLRHFDQPDQELSRPSEERAHRRSCHAGRRGRSDADGRVVVDDILEESDAYRRGLRYGDEIVGFRRPADHDRQRLQERAGHLSTRLARADVVHPPG